MLCGLSKQRVAEAELPGRYAASIQRCTSTHRPLRRSWNLVIVPRMGMPRSFGQCMMTNRERPGSSSSVSTRYSIRQPSH